MLLVMITDIVLKCFMLQKLPWTKALLLSILNLRFAFFGSKHKLLPFEIITH